MMDWLYNKLSWLVETDWFKWVVSILILLNPIALAPQVWTTMTAPSVEGVSILMWLIFLGIQTALAFNGIRTKDKAVFVSMFLSVLESLTIIIVVLVKSS